MSSSRLGETLLPKTLALPVFCSDPLSSNAYATEEILLMLSLGGLALLHLAPWVAGAVGVPLIVVVASYRQTCAAYPNGGGAYAVSRANLGQRPALVAASALLVDYVLTVAVSVAAGVANIVSAAPSLAPSFASGCTALTGVEAVSNGVPNFRVPRSRRAELRLISSAGSPSPPPCEGSSRATRRSAETPALLTRPASYP
jgi:amino acid transporter